MASNNDEGRANDARKDTEDQTSGIDQSSMVRASPDASRTTPPGRPTVSSGNAPTQTEVPTTSKLTSPGPESNARSIASPPGGHHDDSSDEFPRTWDKGTKVPYNKEVMRLFENGPPTNVPPKEHSRLMSWLRHHGHRVGKHNQNDTVALVGNFLRHVHAFPDDFYGRLESPPDAVQRQLNASKRPVRRARKASVPLKSARAPVQSTATGEEVQHDTPGYPTMASPRRSNSSATQSGSDGTRGRNIRGSEGASEAYVAGLTASPTGVSMYARAGISSPSETPPIPGAASALVQGACAPGAGLEDEEQKAKKTHEESKRAECKAELDEDRDDDGSKSFKVTDPLNIVRPSCPNCGSVRCAKNHSEKWCDCECWSCGRAGRR